MDLGLIRRQGRGEGRCWGWDAAGVASEFASKELDTGWLEYGAQVDERGKGQGNEEIILEILIVSAMWQIPGSENKLTVLSVTA